MKSETKRKILVVDDNKDIADVSVQLLTLLGHDARAAYSGKKALTMVQTYVPDFVFLDIGMPYMDGCEVARKIRSMALSKEMVLVAITGYSQQTFAECINEAGFNYHLVKPIGSVEFTRIVAGECERL